MKRVRNILIIGLLCATTWAQAGSSMDRYNIKRALEAAQQQDWETSLRFLGQEINENPDNGYAHAYIAAVCDMMSGYNYYVFAYAKKALRYLPKSDRYMNSEMEGSLASLYLQGTDTARAIEHLEKAVAYNYNAPKFYTRLAGIREQQKEYEKVVAIGDKMVNHMKDMSTVPTSYWLLAEGLNDLKRYDEALSYADKGLALRDIKKEQQGFLHSSKADALAGLKRYDEAIAEAMTTARLGNKRGMQQLIQIADSSDIQPVLDSIEAGFAAEPSQSLWPATASDIYARHNQHVQATYQLLRSARVEASAYTYAMAGNYATHYIGAPEMAEQFYHKALETDSTDARAWGYLADLYHDLGRYEEALSAIDRCLQLDPEQKRFPIPYSLRGLVYMGMHNYPRALEEFYRALVSEKDRDVWSRIALLHRQMGDEAAAQKAVESGLLMMRNDTTMDMLLVMGDTLAAKAKAPKMVRKETSANQQYNAACMYSRMQMPEEAMAALRKSLECGFRNFHHFAWDDDLDNIRELPEFKALVDEYKEKAKLEQAELRALIEGVKE